MPRGIYQRTEKHREICRENIRKGREIAHSLPLTQKQLEVLDRGRRLPRTQKQIATCRMNGRKVGKLPNRKGSLNPHKGNVFGDTFVCHHNDLCHGAERPDDITYMSQREHQKLHSNLQVQNGTHPFLFMQEKPWNRRL